MNTCHYNLNFSQMYLRMILGNCHQSLQCELLFYNPSMAYREGNESVVNWAEEDDGSYHHTTDEAEGPAGPQDSVNLWDKDRTQCSCPTAWSCQPSHVHTLKKEQYRFSKAVAKWNNIFDKHIISCFNYLTCFSPEAWVRGFLNTVCRTLHCRLGSPRQSKCQMRYTGLGVLPECTDTKSVHTGSPLAPKSCWRLWWLQTSDWPVSCFWHLYVKETKQSV